MDEMTVVTLGREALRVALLVGAPMLVAGAVIGLIVSVLQVATSIQDVTITIIPKIVACGLTLLIALPWMIRMLTTFTRQIFQMISTITP
jgi:flagellar biosynthetic protein FliQ